MSGPEEAAFAFHEHSPGEKSTPQEESPQLLQQRIMDLRLRLPETALWPNVMRLYDELEKAGISLRPPCYLSDEWGCPSGVPAIGIPFYLATPRLRALESELGSGAETDREILMYLRHEAGHAFNYAHVLFEEPGWERCFGSYHSEYREEFRPTPFSRNFVVHIPGWYAQKHPDEDFAETFAVWLTPGSEWRERYKSWPALQKLRYVDEVARRVGRRPPQTTLAQPDLEADQMEGTVADYYRERAAGDRLQLELGGNLDQELWQLFEAPGMGILAAHQLVQRRQTEILSAASHYAGVSRATALVVVDHIIARARALGLTASAQDELALVAKLAALTTALGMNFLHTGHFLGGGVPMFHETPEKDRP